MKITVIPPTSVRDFSIDSPVIDDVIYVPAYDTIAKVSVKLKIQKLFWVLKNAGKVFLRSLILFLFLILLKRLYC
jgi:hypothetical protein